MAIFDSAARKIHSGIRRMGRRLSRSVVKRASRKRFERHLRAETLESRRLLAADFQPFHHNRFDAEDVNDDGLISPMDALRVINAINQKSQRDDLYFIDVNNDGLLSPQDALSVINRLNRGELGSHRHDPPIAEPVPSLPAEVRSIDGTNNHLENPELGSTGEELLRIADADYSDGISTPAGDDRPSAREISNVLSTADPDGTRNDRGMSAFIYVWGQFLDHDIDLTSDQGDGGESFNIEVPAGDQQFDPASTGTASISLTRSQFAADTGTSLDNPRQQVSDITAAMPKKPMLALPLTWCHPQILLTSPFYTRSAFSG